MNIYYLPMFVGKDAYNCHKTINIILIKLSCICPLEKKILIMLHIIKCMVLYKSHLAWLYNL